MRLIMLFKGCPHTRMEVFISGENLMSRIPSGTELA